jgi:hypothetical protein
MDHAAILRGILLSGALDDHSAEQVRTALALIMEPPHDPDRSRPHQPTDSTPHP